MGLIHAYMWSGNQAEADAIGKVISGGATGATTEDTQMAEAQKAFNEGRLEDALKEFQALSTEEDVAGAAGDRLDRGCGEMDGSTTRSRAGRSSWESIATTRPASPRRKVSSRRAPPRSEEGLPAWRSSGIGWPRRNRPRRRRRRSISGGRMEEAGDVKGAMALYKPDREPES